MASIYAPATIFTVSTRLYAKTGAATPNPKNKSVKPCFGTRKVVHSMLPGCAPGRCGGIVQRFRNISVLAGVLLCLSVAVCPVWGIIGVNTSQDPFILSNEGSGLITQLVNAGYGNMNPCQALVQIDSNTNPSTAGIITPAFLAALQACPPSSQIFTILLKNLNSPGVSLAISTDGTVQTTSVSGATYDNGTNTLGATISGVGLGYFTHSTTSSPLTSWTNTVSGVSTTYNVFGVAWAPSQAPSQAPAMVPALSPFAVILLAAGLCAAAMYLMRKRMAGFDVKP